MLYYCLEFVDSIAVILYFCSVGVFLVYCIYYLSVSLPGYCYITRLYHILYFCTSDEISSTIFYALCIYLYRTRGLLLFVNLYLHVLHYVYLIYVEI